MNNFFYNDTERKIQKLHEMGYTGNGFSGAIWEVNNEWHSDAVKATCQAWCPDIDLTKVVMSNSHFEDMERIIDMDVDGCNCSWHTSADLDRLKEYTDMVRSQQFDICNEFFDKITVFAAAGNTYTATDVWPACTDVWKDPCLIIGAVDRQSGEYRRSAYSNPVNYLDYAMGGYIYYEGKSRAGTSFSTPKFMGAWYTVASMYLAEFGKKPSWKATKFLVDNMLVDVGAVGHDNQTGFGVLEVRELMEKVERFEFIENQANFKHNGKVEQVIGCNGQGTPITMGNGVTQCPVRKIIQDGVDNLEGTIIAHWSSDSAPTI